ncbi:MAG: putative phage tail assembly chaperone [Serratia marcescens]|uniref:putative phage tail assembly chaperone n=1 Tax=Serratia sp. BNK-4 TaxID=3376141 RepID=UPI002238204F|nr:putative phage tail assembly chaperone [Serratia marcescens]MDU3570650.1 putative phage tail assembly chaperone [Serratia marcescens]MDU3647740.1 putative phage tail assembly chaperone [Serratia marcescens]BEN44486.1 hypothetical protein SMKC056_14320 [Serratia marcescens]
MSKENSGIITLGIGGVDVKFAPTLQAYNKCLNESARAEDVVGAVATYLKRIVVPEYRDALATLLLTPGLGAQIAEKINKVFAPTVEIEVKE